MGKRGPKPEPTVLKLLRGNPGKRAISAREPKPRAAKKTPAPPKYLGAIAKEEWRRVVPELHRLGLLTKVDTTSLAMYCQALARWREADQVITAQGMTFMTEKGYVVQRPEVTIAQKQATLCKQFASEFGLTPSSRTRINVPEQPPEKVDPDEDFLLGGRGKRTG